MTRKTADLVIPTLLVLLCIAAFLGLFIRPGLVDQGHLSLATASDYHAYFVPRFILGSEELFHGRLPLWNPYEYGGIPLLATGQPAALYPPKALLFGLLPHVPALWVYLAIHYVALALTGFLLFEQMGFRGAPLLTALVLWVFPLPLLLSSYNPVRIANVVWMPLLFLFSERLAARRSLRDFASLSLAVGLQLVAGYPESTIDIALLIFVYAVVSKLTGRCKSPFWTTLFTIGTAFALGAIAAGAQLVPLVELAAISHRAKMEVQPAVMPPDYWVDLFMVIPGLLAFVLFGLGVKRALPATAGFVVCWCMMQGGWLLLRRLPGFQMTRFPFVWAFLVPLFYAWVGAHGMEAILADQPSSPRLRKVGLLLALVSSLFFALQMGIALPDVLAGATSKANPVAHYLRTPAAAALSVATGLVFAAASALALRG